MKTLFYSEDLKKSFETKEACLEAEKEYAETLLAERAKKEKRAAEAKEVEEAYKKANDAYREADKLMKEFCRKYGSFHATFTENEQSPFANLIDLFFDTFRF